MNWLARSAWIYKDTAFGDVQAKLAAHQIETVYVDARSVNAAATIAATHAAGLTAGAYADPSWFPGITPASFASWLSSWLNAQLPKTGSEAPPCMVDLEGDWLTKYAADTLSGYRSHQPARPTSVTVAPFQGGYVTAIIPKLAKTGTHLYVQVYYGGMEPADPAAALLEVAREGLPAGLLHPFYDGAALPSDARDGCVFTAERLP